MMGSLYFLIYHFDEFMRVFNQYPQSTDVTFKYLRLLVTRAFNFNAFELSVHMKKKDRY